MTKTDAHGSSHGHHLPTSTHDNHGAEGHGKHATVRSYVIICVVLCAITYLEYHIFTIESLRTSRAFMVPVLLALSLVKFALVVGYYMHLRFDHNVLKKIFIFPLIVAVLVMATLGLLMM